MDLRISGKSKHRVGANGDATIDPAREMNAEKRQRRVWNRIDQHIHKTLAARGQAVTFTSERHKLEILSSVCRHDAFFGQSRRGFLQEEHDDETQNQTGHSQIKHMLDSVILRDPTADGRRHATAKNLART